jgi:hypothetical protein
VSQRGSGGPVTDPSIGPTRPATLVVAGLAAAAVAWVIISRYYGEMQPIPWLPTLTVAVLAVVEGLLAQNTRARIERRRGAPRVDPLAVARYLVLAKASSLAGAIFAGFSAGLFAWLVLDPRKAARADIPASGAALAASLALVGAALWLERSCRVPDQPEDDDVPGRN